MAKYRLYVDRKNRKESGIYEDENQNKYLRIRDGGKNVFVSLKTKSITAAIKLRDARKVSKVSAKLGISVDPNNVAAASKVYVSTVIERYVLDGYPSKKGVPRKVGLHGTAEVKYCKTLLRYFTGRAPAEALTQHNLDEYHAWRVKEVARGTRTTDGHRITDLELNTLCNAMRWAVRKELLKFNPIASRARYYTASDAKHCREFSVQSADELHQAASLFMSSKRSEVLGWQLLIEGMTGLRTDETVTLRFNVASNEPGGLTPDQKNLCVRRAEKSVRQNPYVRVHEGLSEILAAHKIWHAKRYPQSPWYFPGRDRTAAKHVNKSVLTKSLARLHDRYLAFRKTEPDPGKFPDKPYLSKKYTSHGAGRAFYIFARRCQGTPDPEIAYEVNHTGGVGTLEQVYALPPKHWQHKGEAPGMDWLPKGPRAWSKIVGVDFSALDTKPAPTELPSFEI